jgi:glucan phosphorylase
VSPSTVCNSLRCPRFRATGRGSSGWHETCTTWGWTRSKGHKEGAECKIRIANLAIVGSHSTKGMAAIHSELLRTMTVKDLAEQQERSNP